MYFIFENLDKGTFSFSDGTPVTYTNWSPGQGGLSPDEDGVYFGLDGTWSDADITETHKFLFQLRNTGPSFLWSTGETTEYITVTPTVTPTPNVTPTKTATPTITPTNTPT